MPKRPFSLSMLSLHRLVGRVSCAATMAWVSGASTVLAEAWSVPAGCETFLTVQFRECRVANFYRCGADPEDQVWRADFDPEGLLLLTLTDADTVPLRIIDPRAETDLRLDPGSQYSPSLAALLAQPWVNIEYRMIDQSGQGDKFLGMRSRLPASDKLPIKFSSVTIDGVVLEEVIFNVGRGSVSGDYVQVRQGVEYVQLDWRLVFSGPEEHSLPGNLEAFSDVDQSPVDFIFPGEPDFGTTRPTEDCELQLSELALPTVSNLTQPTKGFLP